MGSEHLHDGGFLRVASAEGVCVHSGRLSRVAVVPGQGDGIRFFGPGGHGGPIEELQPAPSERCTALLLPGGGRIAMVEHLLAAFSILGTGGADVFVEGSEIPILDGSSLPWLKLLRQAGYGPSRGRRPLAVVRPFSFVTGGSRYAAWPGPRSVTVTVSYPGTSVGRQTATAGGGHIEHLAAARTFAFESEVEMMRKAGLAAGGSLQNALVIGDRGPINPGGYRFPDEPARHKALDLLGDLMLAGTVIKGRIEAFRPGHAGNRAFLSALLESAALGEACEDFAAA